MHANRKQMRPPVHVSNECSAVFSSHQCSASDALLIAHEVVGRHTSCLYPYGLLHKSHRPYSCTDSLTPSLIPLGPSAILRDHVPSHCIPRWQVFNLHLPVSSALKCLVRPWSGQKAGDQDRTGCIASLASTTNSSGVLPTSCALPYTTGSSSNTPPSCSLEASLPARCPRL